MGGRGKGGERRRRFEYSSILTQEEIYEKKDERE